MCEIQKCFLTENDCYTSNARQRSLPASRQDAGYRRYYQGASRIVVHSTGADNPYLRRYVAPDDGHLGANQYGNHWNRSGVGACVHAFVGRLADGTVGVYQTLPWEYRAWGVGKGKNGSFNDCAIQLEICEDDHNDEGYCLEAYAAAVGLCAGLCKQYRIPADGIVSHREAHDLGYGSNHGDPESWWGSFGLTMDGFRAAVQAKLDQKEEKEMTESDVKTVCGKMISDMTSGSGTGDHPAAWAEEAAAWAKAAGIITGFGGDNMGWQKLLTREQLAVMLYRFARYMGRE